jgi:subtilisin family serine protease
MIRYEYCLNDRCKDAKQAIFSQGSSMSRLFLSLVSPVMGIGCASSVIDMSTITNQEKSNWEDASYENDIILVQNSEFEGADVFYRGEKLNEIVYLDNLGIQAIEIPSYISPLELIAYLRSTGQYASVEPNLMRSLPQHEKTRFVLPEGTTSISNTNDPFLSFQWHMDQIQVNDLTSANWGSGTIVAVIDTGVTAFNDGYGNSLMTGYDFHNGDTDASDDQGHGSHVAGTIAQATNNGVGGRGVAPDTVIMPLKSLGSDGTGFVLSSIEAIDYAIDNGADIINMSLASSGSSTAEETAVNAALNAGIVVVAATGNDGIQSNGVSYPAAYTGVIAVSSVGYSTSALAYYSNAGSEVAFAAPGGDDSTFLNDGVNWDGVLQETLDASTGQGNYYLFQGTSMATPHVAGAYAVLMGAGATGTQATTALIDSATDLGTTGEDDLFGYGLIQISDALDSFTAAQSDSGVDLLAVGDVVISEIMNNPLSIADYKGEWFEIHNTTSSLIDIQGMIITGGTGETLTISSSLPITGNGYAVLGVRSTATGGSSVDYTYSYSNFKMYASDRITLKQTDGTTLDEVSFSPLDPFPQTEGYAMSTSATTPTGNDSGYSWCLAESTFATGDYGTPGSANPACSNPVSGSVSVSALSSGDLIVSEIMHAPASSAYNKGEWFEIYNNSGSSVNLNGLVVTDGMSDSIAVTKDIVLDAGNYAVFAAREASSDNGGITDVAYAYDRSSFRLNDYDQIGLYNGAGILFDSITYDTDEGFPTASGASLSLGSLSASLNDQHDYWCVSSTIFGAGDAGTPGSANENCSLPILSAVGVDTLNYGELIISEVMHDPLSVADYHGEWFEIYNNSGNIVNLNGLNVNGSFTINEDVIVEDQDYAVIAVKEADTLNGGLSNVDHSYNSHSTFSLNLGDIITVSNSSGTLDQLIYSPYMGFEMTAGASIMLADLDADNNDYGAYWCISTSSYGDGDFGTPGTANDNCSLAITSSIGVESLSTGDLVISEIMHNPTVVPDYRGEWFEVYNNSGSDINLNGLQVLGSGSESFAIMEDIAVAAGDYTVFAARSYGNGISGQIDYKYSRSTLKLDQGDRIALVNSSITIDEVIYNPNGGYPNDPGESLTLDILDDASNDIPSSWCSASSDMGSGDMGTPGSANDACN